MSHPGHRDYKNVDDARSDPDRRKGSEHLGVKFATKETVSFQDYAEKGWGSDGLPAQSRGTGFKKRPTVLFAAVGIGMASIAVAGVFIYQFSRPQRPERPSPQSQAPASAGLLSPLEIAENFLSAEFSEERLRWIRDPEIHGESVRTTVLPFPLEKLTSIERPIDQSGILELFHAQFRNNRSHLVCVLDENVFGTRAVDWEAFTRQGSSSWGELVTGEVLSAEMRVFVQPLGRADFIFGEVDTPHFKYAITSPDVEGELYGYVVRGTRTGLSLAKETMGQGKAGPRRMTLVLESQNESHTQQQFLITCVVAAGWVKGDTNLEARTILPHEIQR